VTRPTHVRWHIVGLLGIVSALTYLDRLNLSIAGKHIQDEFAFSNQTMGWILSAFVLGYALFQLPGGWIGDRYGPRGVLTAAVLWWSVFTAATGIAPRLPLAGWFGLAWSFAIIRFLIGVGEAAAFPNSNRIVAFWMGAGQRGIGNSLFLMGIGAGGALTPMFIAALMERWGWRSSFYVCALAVIRDQPAGRASACQRRGVGADPFERPPRRRLATGGLHATGHAVGPHVFQPLRLGSDPQLLLHRLSRLHFLHLVLYLPGAGARAHRDAGRLLGLNTLPGHRAAGAGGRLAF
jgi:MFS family permease